MKGGADLLLQLAVEINQQVSAGDEVGAGERRILQETVPGEQHDVAQLPRDPVVVVFAGEEALDAVVRHVGFDRPRITALASDHQGGVVEVGCEHLKLAADVTPRRLLEQEHGDGIGFLAGGAAGYPGADRIAGGLALEQFSGWRRSTSLSNAAGSRKNIVTEIRRSANSAFDSAALSRRIAR